MSNIISENLFNKITKRSADKKGKKKKKSTKNNKKTKKGEKLKVHQTQANTCIGDMLRASTHYAIKFANMANRIARIKRKGTILKAKKEKGNSFKDTSNYATIAALQCAVDGGSAAIVNSSQLLASCEGNINKQCDFSIMTDNTALHNECKQPIAQYYTSYKKCSKISTTEICTCFQTLLPSKVTTFLTTDCKGIEDQSIEVVKKFNECAKTFRECRRAEDNLLLDIPTCTSTLIVTESPSTNTGSPSSSSEALNTGGPSLSSKAPNTGGPSSNSKAPNTGTVGPSTSSEAASSNTGGPSSSSDAPNTGGPSSSTKAPNTGTIGPSTSSEAPSTNTGGPSSSSDAPNTGGPSSSSKAPNTGTGGQSTSFGVQNTGPGGPSSSSGVSNTGTVGPSSSSDASKTGTGGPTSSSEALNTGT